jgi:hypothetical protein
MEPLGTSARPTTPDISFGQSPRGACGPTAELLGRYLHQVFGFEIYGVSAERDASCPHPIWARSRGRATGQAAWSVFRRSSDAGDKSDRALSAYPLFAVGLMRRNEIHT